MWRLSNAWRGGQRWQRFAVCAATALLAACAEPPPPAPTLQLHAVSFQSLPGWTPTGSRDALAAFIKSCRRWQSRVAASPVADDPRFGTAGDWQRICLQASSLSEVLPVDEADAAQRFLETAFQPYRASDGTDDAGLVTGYYEAVMDGARGRTDEAQTPLYRPLPEMVRIDLGAFDEELAGRTLVGAVDGNRVLPMPTRAEIEGGALAGRGLELAWVNDPVDAFFLHIQGSGRVRLADGGEMRVGYAAKNGHPYYAIGRELISRGELTLETVSMQSIRSWLAAHPEEAAEVMNLNQSYVFFRDLTEEGPIGSQGVVLTAERSVAVDPAFIPLGIPVWLDTVHPLDRPKPLRRLAIAQDTGGAIKGPLRIDLYWGGTEQAAAAAGKMKEQGTLYLLLPRASAVSS